ncbi:protein SPT2 homolog [Uloborus diversus]|uniref:protein SPT2 homolog n=1 Tax=Uloborus diversus TaxID=327109 RepID=UPI00240A1C86|nr:protein SPT2 homolog [Uloborus diversus]
MDFKELLNIADHNKAVASSEASLKMYSSNLPPPKKVSKSGVLSSGVKAFIEKQKAEQRRIESEARKKKEELLALRAQNSKNNKKAKIMASRTKDNDFSRIKLTDDEIEAKKKREAEIVRQNLANKVERMKARIEMEEREKLLPKKRKRKSKHGEEELDNHVHQVEEPVQSLTSKNNTKNVPNKNDVRKPRPPPPPSMSFAELLKVAEQKQYEPVKITVKKEEEKLMTKKEKKLMEEERARLHRKQQKLQEQLANEMRPPKRTPSTPVIKKKVSQKSVESATKQPVVIHVEKSASVKQAPESAKVKFSKNSIESNKSNQNGKVLPNKTQKLDQNLAKKLPDKGNRITVNPESNRKLTLIKDNDNLFNDNPITAKQAVPGKNKITSMNSSHLPSNVPPTPSVDVAKLERELKEKLEKQIEKELEAKLAAKFAAKFGFLQKQKALADQKSSSNRLPDKPKISVPQNRPIPVSKSMDQKNARREFEQFMAFKQAKARKEQKKAFHPNPYLDPPRRLLEPQLQRKPSSNYRIESDEEDDDDDDMSDFIDDGSQNDEDYSKYIQEIFGYDKSRYEDDDDDEVMESSYSQVQQEEVRSAKLGYLEDLEEERKLREEEKRKKMKKKIKR